MLGLVNLKQKQIEEEINDQDVLEERGSLCEVDFNRRLEQQKDFWRVVKSNKSLLCQNI